MRQKKALIFGVTGQDGSYLADILLERGYDVYGTMRHTSTNNLERINHLITPTAQIHILRSDLLDTNSIHGVINSIGLEDGDEIYHEADQDHVGWSYIIPQLSFNTTMMGTWSILEAIRILKKKVKVFVPVSSTIFGTTPPPQIEESPIVPMSPYACAKAGVFHLARYYRECYDMFVSTGILYNHESPRRGDEYFLQKVCYFALQARRCEFKRKPITPFPVNRNDLSNPICIGHARDYMEAANQMLQLNKPTDLIISTGLEPPTMIAWICEVLDKVGISPKTKDEFLKIEEGSYRPGPKQSLVGDNARSIQLLGHYNTHTPQQLISMILTGVADKVNAMMGNGGVQ